ncbi:MAG: SpoIID/LytB domain-containing protein [Candidatus Aureabacteria bacterium]|nr:SpoIID/LytB domain-containing protein [Candidatus Auribacterota bacterium]
MKKIFFALVPVFLTVACLFLTGMAARLKTPVYVKVLMRRDTGSFSLYSDFPVAIENERGKRIGSARAGEKIKVRFPDSSIIVNRKLYRGSSLYFVSEGNINLGGEWLKGKIKVERFPAEGGFSICVVNILELEDYLKGVVPNEVFPCWESEALKAQAVASRSYALYHIINNKGAPYDLNNVSSQLYRGAGTEDKRTSCAIDATRGQVITYKNKVLCAYFATVCGGHTEVPYNVWVNFKDDFPGAVRCGYCDKAPNYSWDYSISSDRLRDRFAEKNINLGEIIKIYPSKKSRYGSRITEVGILHSGGDAKLRIVRFRDILGPENVKSGQFSVVKKGNRFYFTGRGHGHGVGMCQYGARELAVRGWNYKAILSYYYPGSGVKKIY